jgi:hypothetical protein
MADGVTTGDLALMKNNDGLLGGGGFLYVLAILFLFGMMGGGFGFAGGRGPMGPAPATADQMNQGFLNQQLQQIATSSANNNYETAQLINQAVNTLSQQNQTYEINAIQGFNQIGQSIQNQTNVLSGQLMALGAKMDSCCCEIKTQMLQNRYEDERAKNVALQGEISNFQQSQYILGQMGRWVAWLGSGSQAATAGT